mmetsp:Transcript_4359/g.9797  ORF Transcript_4359/g.9797 Transcript_4359/m.9797 type:complete len:216 (+) Transcript_4359:1346-1993(+)
MPEGALPASENTVRDFRSSAGVTTFLPVRCLLSAYNEEKKEELMSFMLDASDAMLSGRIKAAVSAFFSASHFVASAFPTATPIDSDGSDSLGSLPRPTTIYLFALPSTKVLRVGRVEPASAPFLKSLKFSVIRFDRAPPRDSSTSLTAPTNAGSTTSSSLSSSSSSSSSFAGARTPRKTKSTSSLNSDPAVKAASDKGLQAIVLHGSSNDQVSKD